jgi:hypothetical protein
LLALYANIFPFRFVHSLQLVQRAESM